MRVFGGATNQCVSEPVWTVWKIWKIWIFMTGYSFLTGVIRVLRTVKSCS